MRSQLRAIWAASSVLLVAGCVSPEPTKSINTPPADSAAQRKELAEFFAYHQDQGMLHDRSISDIHFVPGSTNLSGTGEAALARYAELLSESGGTLNYDTRLKDESLVNGRLSSARSFLAHYNVGGPQIQVALGMSGGRGMTNLEATADRAVAEQPEPRGKAYNLTRASGFSKTNSK